MSFAMYTMPLYSASVYKDTGTWHMYKMHLQKIKAKQNIIGCIVTLVELLQIPEIL